MKNTLFLLPLILFMTGCQTVAQIPKYSVVVTNGTTNRLTSATVKYGEFESLGGGYAPGQKKVDALVPFPIPEQATVLWKSQSGESHEKLVKVQKVLPQNFSDGDIIFTILEGDKVEVTYKPFFKLPK